MVRGERDDVKQISVIVICTAAHCQCQGDEHVNGGAADALVANLRGRQLPFPVEESGCLGARGMGTMVAIDHHDGNTNLVAGLDLTLTELGVCGVVQESITTNDEVLSLSTAANSEMQSASLAPISMEAPVLISDAPVLLSDAPAQQQQIANLTDESKVSMKAAEMMPLSVQTIQCSTPQPPHGDTQKLVDARDRMRADVAKQTASTDGPTTNPWANVAGHLAKKAGKKLFG
jgi:hypothetical protein